MEWNVLLCITQHILHVKYKTKTLYAQYIIKHILLHVQYIIKNILLHVQYIIKNILLLHVQYIIKNILLHVQYIIKHILLNVHTLTAIIFPVSLCLILFTCPY